MQQHLITLRNGFWAFLAIAAVMWGLDVLQPGSGDRDLAIVMAILSGLAGVGWLRLSYRLRRPAEGLVPGYRPVASADTGREPDGEASYTNALLTVLAKTDKQAVVVTPGTGVPALRPLTTDPELLEWVSALPFKYEQLDGTRVVATLLTLAGYRFYHLFRLSYEFRAVLALSGSDRVDRRFTVLRTHRHPTAPIIVSRTD